MFPRTSRYFDIPIAELTEPGDHVIPYLRRRFPPPTSGTVIFAEHQVEQGDRLDNITARYLGDPEQFWRICHANQTMRPDELTEETGRWIQIPMPAGS
jgi:hypothetical protein